MSSESQNHNHKIKQNSGKSLSEECEFGHVRAEKAQRNRNGGKEAGKPRTVHPGVVVKRLQRQRRVVWAETRVEQRGREECEEVAPVPMA